MERVYFHIHIINNNFDNRIVWKDKGVGGIAINLNICGISSHSCCCVKRGNKRWSVSGPIKEGAVVFRNIIQAALIGVEVHLLHRAVRSGLHCNVQGKGKVWFQ